MSSVTPDHGSTGDHGTQRALAVEFRSVSKAFQQGTRSTLAVDNVSFTVPTGQFVALVGPSGCGKSTLLSMAAGIIATSSGKILLNGSIVRGVSQHIGYLFQRDSLLPWKTVLQSVMLPLRFHGLASSEALERALHWIVRVGLVGFESHYPWQLSGGMRKRVALAQVFAYEPSLLLMDEPFSSLDVQMRNLMEEQLLDLWQEQRKTVLFVTHDLEEAIALADRVIVLTARPAQLKNDYQIRLDRPRHINEIRFDSRFTSQYEAIWQDLRGEVMAAYAGEMSALPAPPVD